MGLFKEVKCGRCDRRYSAIRSRCPYCGARKNKGSKRALELGGRQWQLIAGIALLVLIFTAVIILVTNSLKNREDPEASTSPTIPGDGQVSTVTTSPLPTNTAGMETASPSPSPSPTSALVAITLSHEDVTLSYIGESFTLSPTFSPAGADVKPQWYSEDESIANVNTNGVVTAINRGTTNIVCEAGGIKERCIVRVNADSVSGGGSSGGSSSGEESGGSSSGGLSISHTDVTISSSDSESFTLYVTGASDVSYSSEDPDIASVTSGGTVTAVSPGTTRVTAAAGGDTLVCIVRVT